MNNNKLFLPKHRFDELLNQLKQQGYDCISPQVKDGAIIYDRIDQTKQLPWGIRDQQTPGGYRLEKSDNHMAFSWNNGPQGIKPWLFKPRESLWQVTRDEKGKLTFVPSQATEQPIAFIGARACDIQAMVIQDKVFIESQHQDSRYQQRRSDLLVIAVNCNVSGTNCFCVSAGGGPQATHHFDIALSELADGFVVEVATEKAQAIINPLALDPAISTQQQQAEKHIQYAIDSQQKTMPKNNSIALRDILFANLDHPRWDDVAERCLSCGNCTSVCPTCFCHHQEDKPTLGTEASEHIREWDSCFTSGHSYIHKQVIRDDTKSRYKQWLTHKLGSWWDQFDTSGCVGCGRCITWCPVGIDITEEMAAIAEESSE